MGRAGVDLDRICTPGGRQQAESGSEEIAGIRIGAIFPAPWSIMENLFNSVSYGTDGVCFRAP
jgi:hypothetical protein